MLQTAAVMSEFEQAMAGRDSDARAGTVDRIADLFIGGASGFTEAHVALFDQVIGLLADAIESGARARLAEKFADLANAPPGVVRRLSKDEIAVARPVLARSPRLTDSDLVEAARKGGRDHMLAISERRELSEPVTDVLVREGDRVVVNAVASNPGAKFSPKGYDALVERSHGDELLQATLGRRRDIPARHMAVLFELAKKAARERLQAASDAPGRRAVARAVQASATAIEAETRARSDAYRQAVQDVSGLVQRKGLSEAVLAAFARSGKADHAVVALSYLCKVPLPMAERAVRSADNDALLILARSVDLEWDTVRELYRMRAEHRPQPRALAQLAENYDRLAAQTAQRVLRFLHARDSVAAKR
jgi:uncharacterized protein (DUF2336 family)